MKRYCNENDPRSVVFVSNFDKRYGITFNFAHPPKWRWILDGTMLVLFAIVPCIMENKAVRIGWCILMLLQAMVYPRLLRSMAERQLSLHPGPMGPRSPDGLYATSDLLVVREERRKFFRLMLALLAVWFAVVLVSCICGGMFWLNAAVFSAFLSVMGIALFMIAFGIVGTIGVYDFAAFATKRDAWMIPVGIVLLVAEVLAFAPMTDFCSSRTMQWNLPNGEQTKFRVPINDDRKPHSGDGWKAYRGYRDGKAYLLIESGANVTSVVPVGTKGPVDFVVPPMGGDDITVFNMHSKRVFHVKRGVDGVWSMKGDNTVWVQ